MYIITNTVRRLNKMNKKLILTVIVLILIFEGKINAQIITDRPDQTESSSTIFIGALQIESGLLVSYEGNNQTSTRQFLLPTNLFRYGITDNFELRVLNQFETLKTGTERFQGIANLEIGTKIQILKNKNLNTKIAFLTHLVVPTGTKELTDGGYGSINKISISHELNENIGIGYNLGYNYFENGDAGITYSLAFGIGVNKKVGVYIEPYGELKSFKESKLNFDAGFTYLTNINFQLDFSFGLGLNYKMNYMSIGFSWLIDRDKE